MLRLTLAVLALGLAGCADAPTGPAGKIGQNSNQWR